MFRWLQRFLRPNLFPPRSAEGLSTDEDGQPILNSNFEWLVEIDGRPAALLTDSQWADMFWNSYRMTPLTDDPETLAQLQDVEFWRACETRGVKFRNRATSLVAEYAFPGWDPFPEPGRIVMRGI
jgi:hypothetical protein